MFTVPCQLYLSCTVSEILPYRIHEIIELICWCMQGYQSKNAMYIATQMPLQSTVSDFWRLVKDNACTAIVMLNSLDSTSSSEVSITSIWYSLIPESKSLLNVLQSQQLLLGARQISGKFSVFQRARETINLLSRSCAEDDRLSVQLPSACLTLANLLISSSFSADSFTWSYWNVDAVILCLSFCLNDI